MQPPSTRGRRLGIALLALSAGLAASALAGCGLLGRAEDQHLDGITTRAGVGRPAITVGELDLMARNYSDRLVARISSACDEIKRKSQGDPGRRANAHHLQLSIALAAYDIVSSAGGSPQQPAAGQHVVDLAILTELETLHWADEGAARDQFGEQDGQTLVQAFQDSRADIWTIAGKLMDQKEVDNLKTLVARWRTKNPKVEWLARVRFDVIAQGQEADSVRKAVTNAFNPIQGVTHSADEIRMAAQQAFFYMRRAPLLLDWTTEATVSDTLQIPGIHDIVDRLHQSMERMSTVAGEVGRLLEPSSQEPAINSTISDVRDTVVQTRDLLREAHALEQAIQPYLEKSASAPRTGKPTDYAAVASRVDDAARSATELVRETKELAESPRAVGNMEEALGRLSQDLDRKGRDLVDHAAWRAIEVVIVIAVIVALFLLVAWAIRRRRRKPEPQRT